MLKSSELVLELSGKGKRYIFKIDDGLRIKRLKQSFYKLRRANGDLEYGIKFESPQIGTMFYRHISQLQSYIRSKSP